MGFRYNPDTGEGRLRPSPLVIRGASRAMGAGLRMTATVQVVDGSWTKLHASPSGSVEGRTP